MSTLKLPAASGGGSISIKGPTSLSSDVDLLDTSGNLKLLDNQKVKLGTGDDLEIYHSGSHSHIKDSGTGHLQIDGSRVQLRNIANDDPMVDCTGGGTVELYHNGTKKLETTSAGGTLTGNWAGKVGLQNAQQWRVNSNFTMSQSGAVIDSNWEYVDSDSGNSIGTSMSESSGIFTFPSTGIWLIHFFFTTQNTAGDSKYNEVQIQTTSNNSSYGEAAAAYCCNDTTGFISAGSANFIFDVTDTANYKVRFSGFAWSGNTTFYGHSTTCQNGATFIRLGDT